MDPNWSQKLRNSGPEPDLEKTSDKKPQNINSVHYLLCFKHIQVLPKASLFVTVLAPKLVPEPLRKGSPKKAYKKVTIFIKKNPKKDPGGTPKRSQNPSKSDLFWTFARHQKHQKPDFTGCAGRGPPPFFIKLQ